MKNNFIEGVTALALLVLAVLVLNPAKLFMPDMVLSGMLVGLLTLFCIFALFVVREQAQDEREALHRMYAGRAAFLAGSLVLVVGIIAQGSRHAVDSWLVSALVIMVLAKLATRFYGDYRL